MPTTRFDDLIVSHVQHIKSWGERHRRAILLICGCAFLAGISISIDRIGLSIDGLDLVSILLICVVAAPVSILLNAMELQLCARAVRQSLSLRQAVAVSSTASVANLLPIPAGVIIRGGALVAVGAGIRDVGIILVAAGLMWLALALLITGAFLAGVMFAGAVVAIGSAFAAVALVYWIARRSSTVVALGFVGVRAALLAVLAIRLYLSFAAIGISTPLIDTALYTVAGVAGTVVMVVPAGLGVSEGIAAAMAKLVGDSPAAAFLALGLNRILGLLISAAVAAFFWINRTKPV